MKLQREVSYRVSTMRHASYDANKEVFLRRSDPELEAATVLEHLKASGALSAGRDSIRVFSADAKSCQIPSCCCASSLERSSNERTLPGCWCWRTGNCWTGRQSSDSEWLWRYPRRCWKTVGSSDASRAALLTTFRWFCPPKSQCFPVTAPAPLLLNALADYR